MRLEPTVYSPARITRLVLLALLAFGLTPKISALLEGSFLYFPSHETAQSGLVPWIVDGQLIGYARTVASPHRVWLVCHGNAGQASQRGYIADCLPATDSVYLLEYPGYGHRAGTPSMSSINAAAVAAYAALLREHPSGQIAVLSESLGSGPVAYLCSLADPPGRAVLVVPFDNLLSVAKEHLPFLPVSLLMRDKWDNVARLSHYTGRIDIFGATLDEVIPVAHARNLAHALPAAHYHEINCGHNDWSTLVRIEN